MRARSLYAQGRVFSEPRSSLADSEGRSPESAPPGSLFFCLLFFGDAKKSEPRAAGVRKPCNFKQ